MTWHARFISSTEEFDGAPLLRREFSLDRGHGAIRSAELAVTALGVVEASLNGRAVSGDLLTPGWSSYEWRIRVARYDVTDRIAERNVLGLALGNGWFRGRLGWTGRRALYGDRLAGFAELTIVFDDGAVQRIASDGSWQSGPSSVVENDLYGGETIDARRRSDDWQRPGFEGAGWTAVEVLDHSLDALTDYIGPKVVRQQEVAVERIWTSPSGHTLIDFGQNLVGWVRLTVQGPEGAEIVVRHAEVLENDELGTRPLRSAAATDRYILSGREDVFEPTLTFHGFRYAEITGWPGELRADQLTAVVIGSDLERIGTFECSDPLLNRFHQNVVWGMRGNFVDVPTDCPQRDERLGWTGDIAAFAPTAAYLYDVEAFLSDWLADLTEEQRHANGIIPFVVPDAIKYFGGVSRHGDGTAPTALWGDAGVWVPWDLYQAYGDERVLEAQFGSMTAHVRAIEGAMSTPGLWDTGYQFGDWLDPDAPPEAPDQVKADPYVVATACGYRSVLLTARAAAVLGHESERREFEALASRMKTAFQEHYVREGRILSDSTTVYALAIVFGLVEGEDLVSAGERLAELTAQAKYRISTGFAGTPFITDALSMTGHVDVAYRLLLERENPSWLYSVTMGATTVWERWDSMLPDGSINPGEMTSFNHYALGGVADWMHRTIGGISPLEPGYSRILLAPQPGGDLSWASASLVTPHGRVAVDWRLSEDGLHVDVEVPMATTAILRLPGVDDVELRGGRHSQIVPFDRVGS
ncbi:family 78 glycoside hydrolase catalytic domain [Parafrigoribacterium humi]|uniref:family 78 glycoside hydrolase catalytic domain n=1 Tax=Parafrigoribacterium humi TaxID=3144664 RepID=UPI0032EBC4C5